MPCFRVVRKNFGNVKKASRTRMRRTPFTMHWSHASSFGLAFGAGNGGASEGEGKRSNTIRSVQQNDGIPRCGGEDINYRIYVQLCQVCKTSSKCNFTICFSLPSFNFRTPPTETFQKSSWQSARKECSQEFQLAAGLAREGHHYDPLPRWTHTQRVHMGVTCQLPEHYLQCPQVTPVSMFIVWGLLVVTHVEWRWDVA